MASALWLGAYPHSLLIYGVLRPGTRAASVWRLSDSSVTIGVALEEVDKCFPHLRSFSKAPEIRTGDVAQALNVCASVAPQVRGFPGASETPPALCQQHVPGVHASEAVRATAARPAGHFGSEASPGDPHSLRSRISHSRQIL